MRRTSSNSITVESVSKSHPVICKMICYFVLQNLFVLQNEIVVLSYINIKRTSTYYSSAGSSIYYGRIVVVSIMVG